MLTVGSLFAGIGGLDLGLERAGMQVRWQVENDPYCIRVLEKHWPDVKRYGDVRSIDWKEVEAVDLICGGFPCQSVSVAGQRKGDKDKRWLWPEFLRAIREVRPRYALVENVPGLLSTDDGRLARGVFGDLAENGYDAEWNIVSAFDVEAPHVRKRIFIVAYSSESISNSEEVNGTWPEFEGNRIGQSEKEIGDGSAIVENTLGNGRSERPRSKRQGTVEGIVGSSVWSETSDVIARTNLGREVIGRRIFRSRPTPCDFWAVEPDVGRVADGVPSRVERLKCIGNAVVPQVAEYIGRLIIEYERGGR